MYRRSASFMLLLLLALAAASCSGSTPNNALNPAGPDAACTEGAKDCAGDTPRLCVQGAWVAQAACTGVAPVCKAGTCGCQEGAKDCVGTTPRLCSSGQWVVQAPCTGDTATCESGACVAKCTEGGRDCSANTPRLCTKGAWVSQAVCAGNTPTCAAGSCVCVAETDSALCARLGKGCGSVSGADNCGASRTVASCGTCAASQSCVTNVCTAKAGPDAGEEAGADATVDAGRDAATPADAASDATACVPETDVALCARNGKNCGALSSTDNCGAARAVPSCGTCILPQSCGAMAPNVCGCSVESDAAFCSRLGKACGSFGGTDSCGLARTANCGTCSQGQQCTANACVCAPETDQALCIRLVKNCGSMTAFDNCGNSRTTNCGSCGVSQTCGAVTANVCGCVPEGDTAFCSRVNKTCGAVTAPDNCGASRSVSSCGTCTTGQTCTAGVCASPPSCTGLANTCGLGGSESCCSTGTTIPGGTFNRSDLSTAPATVSEFRLDRFEATVGRFRKFVAAYPGNKPAVGSGKNANNALDPGWDSSYNASLAADQAALITGLKCDSTFQTWTDAAGGNETRPINCVTWFDAYAFCIWDGGRLPTEAEWNYAAAGGAEQRVYPWSTPPTSTTINSAYASYNDGTNCVGDGLPGCALTDLIVVGSKPSGDSKWGQADMGGNVTEWTQDWYADPYSSSCTNCANLAMSTFRVLRGGRFSGDASALRAAHRDYGPPSNNRHWTFGIRCARTP